jgi:toxin ParE1/3/4
MKVVLSDRARADLHRIFSYLAERNLGAAERLIEAVDRKLVQLAQFPFLGRERSTLRDGLRSVLVGSHVVFYVVRDSEVRVVRVVDGRMDLNEEFSR